MKGKLSFMWRATLALVLVLSLGVVMAVPVSAAPITDVDASPANDMAGATTTYAIGFTTITTYVIDSVEMEFAAGFDVSGAALSGTPGNIGAGTIGVSGQVVTYSVTAPALLGAVAVTISLSGIVNAAAATYDPGVTIRTKSGVATIDSGTDAVTIVSAPVSFLVVTQGSGTQIAGAAFTVTMTAMSQAAGAGSPVTGYTGAHLIDFSSTASNPKTIPAFAVITFANGVGTLTGVVLNVAETGKTITATDSVISVSGTSGDITVTAGAAHHLTISGAPAAVTAGVAFSSDVTVTAYDASGNVATGDTQTVHWSGGGTGATLPADHALVLGTYTFLKAGFILETVGAVAGAQTITATELAGTKLSAPATVTVNPAAASTLTIEVDPASIAADGSDSSTVTITAKDEFTNIDTNYVAAVTFATSLGTLSEVDANFVSGVATATLTSTADVGTATILVSSGSLTDVTTTVTLTDAPAEVWVKATTGNDDNPGTEALPFLTIAKGITEAGVNGTVNVLQGTYAISSTIVINTAGLTLQSTGTAAETILDASVNAIDITAVDVIVDGFTIEATGIGIHVVTGDDATVINNIITGDPWQTGIRIDADGATVSGNELDINCTMWVSGSLGTTLSDNTFGAGMNLDGTTSELTISGNDLTGSEFEGINFDAAGTYDDILIQNNIISEVTEGDVIGICVRGTITNLQILNNDITDNEGDGIRILDAVTWGAGNAINNNNISGNLVKGISNLGSEIIDAENNWWGDASGPYVTTTNTGGTGDEVTTAVVDYRPWLAAPYSTPSTTISLESDWNLISLMLLPTDPDIDTVLAGADVTVNKVAYFTGGPTGGWLSWFPSAPSNLEEMDDGKGYWIDVSAAGELAVAGVELALPGEAPPTYDVVVGWNLIGFTSTTGKTVDVYLGSVLATVQAMYGYNAAAGLYEAVLAGNNLASGQGYWLAVNTAGKIYP